ncbi:hypothetical protein DMH17_01160 [Raoultella planticola]|nr:hypothetical protein [Raoultella planticola]
MGGLATADFPRSEPCPVALRLPGLRSCRLLQAQRPGEFPQAVPRTCPGTGLPGLRSCRPEQAHAARRISAGGAAHLSGSGLPGLRSYRPVQAQRPGEFPQTVPRTCRARLTGPTVL